MKFREGAWDELKGRDGSGAEAGDRIELGDMRFVLAAYDPVSDMWLAAPASAVAAMTGARELTAEFIHTGPGVVLIPRNANASDVEYIRKWGPMPRGQMEAVRGRAW